MHLKTFFFGILLFSVNRLNYFRRWWWQRCRWCHFWFCIITFPKDFGLTSWVFSIPSVLDVMVMMIIMMIGRWEPFGNNYWSPDLFPIRKPNFFPVGHPDLFPCLFPFKLLVWHPFKFFRWLNKFFRLICFLGKYFLLNEWNFLLTFQYFCHASTHVSFLSGTQICTLSIKHNILKWKFSWC